MLDRIRSLRDRLRGTERHAPPAPAPTLAVAAPPATAPRPRTTPHCYPADLDGVRRLMVPNGKPRVVNHWATWCPPCVDELPRLIEAAELLAGSVEFVGISWDRFENPGPPERVAAEVAEFAGEQGVPYESAVFTGTPDELFEGLALTCRFIPQTFVLAADGAVLRHIQGEITPADVRALLDVLRPGS